MFIIDSEKSVRTIVMISRDGAAWAIEGAYCDLTTDDLATIKQISPSHRYVTTVPRHSFTKHFRLSHDYLAVDIFAEERAVWVQKVK